MLVFARKNGCALPDLQNDLQQSTGVHASDRRHDRRDLQEPILTAQHFGAQMAFAIECQNWKVHGVCNTV